MAIESTSNHKPEAVARYKEVLQAVLDHPDSNVWETTFATSILAKLERWDVKTWLTERQLEAIKTIEKKVFKS